MYPFPQSINPAVRTHVDAQTAFLNDMSKSLFRSFQQMCDLNIQLVQTMLEETTLAGKQVLSADRQSELLSAATSRTQPAADKLRAYQHHIARLAADAQVELARVTEQHVQNTTRTARALADEVARDATEQEQLEAFILARIEGGAKLAGTYPPNAETRAAYEAARSTKGACIVRMMPPCPCTIGLGRPVVPLE